MARSPKNGEQDIKHPASSKRDAVKSSSSQLGHPANLARSPKAEPRGSQHASIEERDADASAPSDSTLRPTAKISRSAAKNQRSRIVNKRSPQQETYKERSADPEALVIVHD